MVSRNDKAAMISEVKEELKIIDITTSPNILLIIAEDMGLDACPGYNIGYLKSNMPNYQNLYLLTSQVSMLTHYPIT